MRGDGRLWDMQNKEGVGVGGAGQASLVARHACCGNGGSAHVVHAGGMGHPARSKGQQKCGPMSGAEWGCAGRVEVGCGV